MAKVKMDVWSRLRLWPQTMLMVTLLGGLSLLPETVADNRRYMFPENTMLPIRSSKVQEVPPVGVQAIIFPTSIPFLEGFTEVSFSKFHICSDTCVMLLTNVTQQCDNCLLTRRVGSFTQMARWQLVADVLIAIAYFSIPIELLFFIYRTKVFPYKWVVAQFGLFIVLCGMTHLITVWTYVTHSRSSFVTMTFFKAITATISCATAVSMLWVLPELLSVKTRELFLTKKTAELGREFGKIQKQEEIGRHVRMLTDEIRSTLDRHTILHTTLVELARTLNLQDTGIWMPNLDSRTMELTHDVDSHFTQAPLAVPMKDETVQKIFDTTGPVVIPKDCELARLTCTQSYGEMLDAHVAAVRLPLLTTTDFNRNSPGRDVLLNEASQALLVLALPNKSDRHWGVNELDLINSVVNQVAVALSHATILEESMRARNQVLAQNAELQEARQEVEHAMAARNELIAVMNHEMRTPMHAIIALSSLLLQSGLTCDQKTMVDTLNRSSGLLQTLIDDFLDFSKLEIGKLVLDPGSFELQVLCKEAENILKPMALSKNLDFDWELRDIPRKVLGDSKRILQILLNVIGNAIKFTTKGGVKVSAYMGANVEVQPAVHEVLPACTKRRPFKVVYRYLHIHVQDTGVGITTENISRLFNKFVQADSSTTRRFGGTGLGLAICKKFVELMGGTISLESEGIGRGSVCKVSVVVGVPEDVVTERPTGESRRTSIDAHLPKVKVLVVDDNIINRMVTGRLLQALGCQTVVVDSGPACLKILADKGPTAFDILLLDLCMPEMDGFTVATEIIKTYGNEFRPLIAALTANADGRTRAQVFEVGMDSILLKPITVDRLREELTKLLLLKGDEELRLGG